MKLKKLKQSEVKDYKGPMNFNQVILFPEYMPHISYGIESVKPVYSRYFVSSEFTPEEWTDFCNSAKCSHLIGLTDSYFQINLHLAKIKYVKYECEMDEGSAKSMIHSIPGTIMIKHNNYGKI